MHHAVEQILGFPLVKVAIDAVYAGALGAAIHAQQLFASERITESKGTSYHLDLTDLENRISAHHENLISSGDKIKKVGYLCTYTPLELINASGAAHLRLYKAGDTDVVASGEQITQSVFCDFTKSILGAFKEGDKLYNSLDKIYTFYTCDCIKKVGEAIGAFFKPSEVFDTPRLRHKDSSRDFYLSEILYFKEDLERLTGKEITEEQVSAQIKIYNKVRVLLKKSPSCASGTTLPHRQGFPRPHQGLLLPARRGSGRALHPGLRKALGGPGHWRQAHPPADGWRHCGRRRQAHSRAHRG